MTQTPPEKSRKPSKQTLIAGIAVLVVVVSVALFALIRSAESSQENANSPNAAIESATSPSTGSDSPTAPTPSPLATVPADPVHYCTVWNNLGVKSRISVDDDEGVDFKELERVFGELHERYETAHDAAPPSLRGDYSKVLGYLKRSQLAIKSGDIEEIRIMVTHLDVLNASMEKIEDDSKRICG